LDRGFFEDLWLVLFLVPYVIDFMSTLFLLSQEEWSIRFFTSRWPRVWIIVNFLVALLLFLLVLSCRWKAKTSVEPILGCNRDRWYLGFFLCLGFLLRLYAASVMHFGDPDEFAYVLHARELSFERGFVYPLLQRAFWGIWGSLFSPMPAPRPLLEGPLSRLTDTYMWASLLFATRCFSVLLNTFSLVLLFLIGRKMFGERTAILATILHSVNHVMITGVESHTYSENLSKFFFLLSILLLTQALELRESRPKFRFFLGGILLGLSFSSRLAMGLFLPPFLLILFLFSNRSSLLRFLLGFSIIAVTEGYAELLTKGVFFGGALWLIGFNLIEGKSVLFGVEPWYAYLQWIHRFAGFALAFLFYAVRRVRAIYLLGILILPFLGVFSLVPHKELRFISCLFPLIHLLAAHGLVRAGLRSSAVRLSVAHSLAYGILMTILW